MMLSSKQVLGLVDQVGKPGVRGAVEAAKRAAPQHGPGAHTPAQQRLLTAMQTETPAATPETYQHPRDANASARRATLQPTGTASNPQATSDRSLTPSEIAWLSRIPNDPAIVPFDDAAQLFKISREVEHNDDRRLVNNILAPIADYHDAAQARVAIHNANRPVTPIPSEALAALTDSVAAENPTLTSGEAIGRAGKMLQDVATQRDTDRYDSQTAAHAVLQSVADATAKRTAVHR